MVCRRRLQMLRRAACQPVVSSPKLVSIFAGFFEVNLETAHVGRTTHRIWTGVMSTWSKTFSIVALSTLH